MRTILGLFAALLFLGTIVWWYSAGAHRGWSKNTVAIRTVDEITGIEQITEEDRFVPGVDTLAIASGASLLLGGVGLLIRRRNSNPIPPAQ